MAAGGILVAWRRTGNLIKKRMIFDFSVFLFCGAVGRGVIVYPSNTVEAFF